MLQGHPRGLQNPFLVVIVRCWETASNDSQSDPLLGREMRRWKRSSPQDSLDRMSGTTLPTYLCRIGSVGRRVRFDRYPSDRLVRPRSLRRYSSTVLQRLLAVLTIHCLLETVGQDLHRNVSLRNQKNMNMNSITQSSQIVQKLLVGYPRGPTPNRRTAGSAFVPLAQRTSAYSRSCVKACWRHTEALTARAIFAVRIIVEDTAISTVVQFVNSLSMSPAVVR
jgi:hypothetical protein